MHGKMSTREHRTQTALTVNYNIIIIHNYIYIYYSSYVGLHRLLDLANVHTCTLLSEPAIQLS